MDVSDAKRLKALEDESRRLHTRQVGGIGFMSGQDVLGHLIDIGQLYTSVYEEVQYEAQFNQSRSLSAASARGALAKHGQSATAFDRFVLKVVLGIGAVQNCENRRELFK